MARSALADPLAALDEARLARLACIAGQLLGAKPARPGNALLHLRASDAGLEFMEHRQIRPGDDPRHVDWRASARHRSLLVRRYRDERAGAWTLCLDCSASMGAASGVWTLALTLTAALAFVLLALNHRVGLVLFSTGVDQHLPPGRGRSGYVALRRVLAAAQPRARGGDSRLEACLRVVDRGTDAAVISDFLRPDTLSPALSRLAVHCAGVHALQVQGEVAVTPTDGHLSLEDAESGERLDTLWAPELVRGAAQRHRALAQELEEHCRRRRIRYTAAATDSSWERALLTHLLGREPELG
jgi:uncharacterized protein (DUF58 family)